MVRVLKSAARFNKSMKIGQSQSLCTHCYSSSSSRPRVWALSLFSRSMHSVKWCSSMLRTSFSSTTSQPTRLWRQFLSEPDLPSSTTTSLIWLWTNAVAEFTLLILTGSSKFGTLNRTHPSLRRESLSAPTKVEKTSWASTTRIHSMMLSLDSSACKNPTSKCWSSIQLVLMARSFLLIQSRS